MGWGEEGTENYYLIGVGFFVKNYKKKKGAGNGWW